MRHLTAQAAPRGRFVLFWKALFLTALLGLSACSGGDSFNPKDWLEPGEELSGGDTTVFENSERAFSLSSPNLSPEGEMKFLVGDSFFDQNWVIAPASTDTRDGLGPVFNARSCSGCHSKDGRGRPPLSADEPLLGLLFRLSVPGSDEMGRPLPEPHYGLQLNHQSIPGVPAEGTVAVLYEEIPGIFEDGEPFSLRKPLYEFHDLNFGPLDPNTLFSPRVAPQIPGLGLLDALAEETILANADPDDQDGDGISGRPNYVWDVVNAKTSLGRFGWKANQATLHQQVAGAFLGDIGITSSVFPDENCVAGQTDCQGAVNGGTPELSEDILGAVSFYSHTLAVPSRRNWSDDIVLTGKKLFSDARCTACHIPKFQTGTLEGFPELSNQTIRPYTDILIHDMGPGLADGRPDFLAEGNEWRTPPLWGIGLVQIVNGHTNFLHDGRARNFTEAVLWHGGEAEGSKETFRKMTKSDRDALIQFLESL